MTNIPCPKCGRPLSDEAPMGLCPDCLLAAGLGTVTHETTAFIAPEPAELAPRFPELEIFELLGRGGMGAVYRARQIRLDRMVALKILPPGIGAGPAFAERFEREARALAKLQHPHIVTLYEFGERDGQFYFLMEYVDGLNLRRLLNSGRIAPSQALAIVPQICEALQFAHDRGIVHRDIKPENVLLSKEGRVKIADFGVAKILAGNALESSSSNAAPPTAGQTLAGEVIGTPPYMAPEQISHPRDVDNRADIYALGVVFYQMLTGELPSGKFAPPSRGRAEVDGRLDEVVLRALEKNPDARYQQANVLKTEVETIRETPGTSARRGLSVMRISGLVALALFFAGLAGTVVLFQRFTSFGPEPVNPSQLTTHLGWLPVIALAIQLLIFGVWLYGLVHVLRNRGLESTERILWAAMVLVLPFIGATLYFLFAPDRKTPEKQPPPRTATPAPGNSFGPFFAKSALILFMLGFALILPVVVSAPGGHDEQTMALAGIACWGLSFILGCFTLGSLPGRISVIGTVSITALIVLLAAHRSTEAGKRGLIDEQRLREFAQNARMRTEQQARDEMLRTDSVPGVIFRVKVETFSPDGDLRGATDSAMDNYLSSGAFASDLRKAAGGTPANLAVEGTPIRGTSLFTIRLKSTAPAVLAVATAQALPVLNAFAKSHLQEPGHPPGFRYFVHMIDPPSPTDVPADGPEGR